MEHPSQRREVQTIYLLTQFSTQQCAHYLPQCGLVSTMTQSDFMAKRYTVYYIQLEGTGSQLATQGRGLLARSAGGGRSIRCGLYTHALSAILDKLMLSCLQLLQSSCYVFIVLTTPSTCITGPRHIP